MLIPEQIEAIKFYQGDVKQCDDPFLSDPKGYVTLNSLFFPDLDTEIKRAKEGKRLNPAIIKNQKLLYDICSNLITSFKCVDLSKDKKAYRVERYADYLQMAIRKETISFTSTSINGFLKQYGDRIGIALLEFDIPTNVYCLPFYEILKDDYKKVEEGEILLPPGLKLDIQEMQLTAEDLEIKDAQDNPPLIKCHIRVSNNDTQNESSEFEYSDNETIEAAMRVYDCLNNGLQPQKEDIEKYLLMKQSFRKQMLALL